MAKAVYDMVEGIVASMLKFGVKGRVLYKGVITIPLPPESLERALKELESVHSPVTMPILYAGFSFNLVSEDDFPDQSH